MNILLKRSTDGNKHSLIFSETNLQTVNKHKHLGIILNEKLKWSGHIYYIVPSVSKLLHVFQNLKYKLNRSSLESIYNSFVLPKLEYGCILFDDCTDADKTCLESIQLCFGVL